MGQLNDDETLALAYSAADVMVVSSIRENLPNTAIESIACGIPVVAFNIGGLPDIIDHKKNGYLVEPYDSKDLTDGIEWTLANDERIQMLSRNARNTALDKFDIRKTSKKYIDLYSKVLSKKY